LIDITKPETLILFMNRYLYFVTSVAALAGLMFGFETGVINGAMDYVAVHFQLSPAMKGFAVSSALVGCIFGAIGIGGLSDKYGRRDMLKVTAGFFLISMIGTGLAPDIMVFILARFIGGLAIGAASVLVPVYISEVSPPDIRGKLVVANQFALVFGILFAFFSNFIIDSIGNNNWRYMFLVGTIPSIILFSLLFFIGRTPRWLVDKNLIEEAELMIKRVNPRANVNELIVSIKESLDKEAEGNEIALFRKPYFRLVMIGFAVGMFNQLTGINVIMYYSTSIFRTAGFSGENAMWQSVLIGLTNLTFTVIGMFLIDRFGRKTLLYIGAVGMPVFLGLFSYSYISGHTTGYSLLIYLIGYIAFFAISQGAVLLVILSEMFPTSIRARGMAIGTFSHWIFNFLISLLFPIAVAKVGVGWVFSFFFATTTVSIFFYRFALIETKGKSLEEIEKLVLGIK
jgi:sugar porter (SP) family MFS transporter